MVREEAIEVVQPRACQADAGAMPLRERATTAPPDPESEIIAQRRAAMAVTITQNNDNRPECASAAPASRTVSPGTGTPAFSRSTPTNTTAYP